MDPAATTGLSFEARPSPLTGNLSTSFPHDNGYLCRISKLGHQGNLVIPQGWHALDTPRLLEKLGLTTQSGGGFMYLSPLQQRILGRVEAVVKSEFNQSGFCEAALPQIVPSRLLEMSGKLTTFQRELLMLHGRAEGYMLADTSEEIFLEGLKKGGLASYKQLPIREFYIQDCYHWIDRAEGYYSTRAIHAAIVSCLDADIHGFRASLASFGEACERIFKRIGVDTVRSDAADGSAVEFLFSNSRGDRTLEESVSRRKAIDGESEPMPDTPGPKMSSLSMGYRFPVVGPFNLRFVDKLGQRREPIMGTCGIGLQRAVYAIFENSRTERGVSFAPAVRPFDVVVVTVPGLQESGVKKALELSESLRRSGLSVAVDDRQDSLLGEKFRFADFYNIPLRLVIGEKEISQGLVEWRSIDDSGRYKVRLEEIPNLIHA